MRCASGTRVVCGRRGLGAHLLELEEDGLRPSNNGASRQPRDGVPGWRRRVPRDSTEHKRRPSAREAVVLWSRHVDGVVRMERSLQALGLQISAPTIMIRERGSPSASTCESQGTTRPARQQAR